MKTIILFYILHVFGHQYLGAQTQFRNNVRLYNYETGADMGGGKIEHLYIYTIDRDTCIDSQRIYILTGGEYDSTFQRYWTSIRGGVRLDSISNKIYYRSNVRYSTTETELYDFNLVQGSINKYGYTCDSIRYYLYDDTLRKFFFFSKDYPRMSFRKYDIWMDGFGSVVNNYINPDYYLIVDGVNFNYNRRINFGNRWQLLRTEYQKAHLNFSTIRLSSDMDLPKQHISYYCDGTVDSMNILNKCEDSHYVFTVNYSLDTQTIYRCKDTIKFQYSITGDTSNKIILWKYGNNGISVVDYPSIYTQQVAYSNSVRIMNRDSSCEKRYNYNTIYPKCTYCHNPIHNPKITIECNKDTFGCKDSLKVNITSNGASDSLWYNISPPLQYHQNGSQWTNVVYGNRYCVRDSFIKNFYIICISIDSNTPPKDTLKPLPRDTSSHASIPFDNLNNNILLYLNPTSRQIVIESALSPLYVTIYNTMGQNMNCSQIHSDSRVHGALKRQVYDVSNLRTGAYIFHIMDRHGCSIIKRLFIEH